jgi:hypothetical protein
LSNALLNFLKQLKPDPARGVIAHLEKLSGLTPPDALEDLSYPDINLNSEMPQRAKPASRPILEVGGHSHSMAIGAQGRAMQSISTDSGTATGTAAGAAPAVSDGHKLANLLKRSLCQQLKNTCG